MSVTTQILVAVAWADIIVQAIIRGILWVIKWTAILFALVLFVKLIRRH